MPKAGRLEAVQIASQLAETRKDRLEKIGKGY
jgi:hypothetical protein